MTQTTHFRVEHRQPGITRVLAILQNAKLHASTLDPFVSRLLYDGKQGTVVLVNEDTGAIVAKRRLPVRNGSDN